MNYFLLALVLVIQNISFTFVSRARNSKSLKYHAIASLFSNGIWFITQASIVNEMFKIFSTGQWAEIIPLGILYTACTLTGSLAAHWYALNKIETKL